MVFTGKLVYGQLTLVVVATPGGVLTNYCLAQFALGDIEVIAAAVIIEQAVRVLFAVTTDSDRHLLDHLSNSNSASNYHVDPFVVSSDRHLGHLCQVPRHIILALDSVTTSRFGDTIAVRYMITTTNKKKTSMMMMNKTHKMIRKQH